MFPASNSCLSAHQGLLHIYGCLTLLPEEPSDEEAQENQQSLVLEKICFIVRQKILEVTVPCSCSTELLAN